MNHPLLEVIACSVEDAIEAEAGGADRLEVVSRLDVGGLTPSIDLVRQIYAEVSLPLRVMVRESVGFEVVNEDEMQRLCESAAACNEIGVDGIVIGFLKNAEFDIELVAMVLARAPDVKATFHHAFEAANNKWSIIAKLKNFPQIDRILAHGGEGDWIEKTKRLVSYQQACSPGIGILVGGGLDKSVIKMLSKRSNFNEFHVGSAVREDGEVKRYKVTEIKKSMSDMLF